MGKVVKFPSGRRPAARKRSTAPRSYRHNRRTPRTGRGFLAWWLLLLAAFLLLVPSLILNLFTPLADALPASLRDQGRHVARQVAQWTSGWWPGSTGATRPAPVRAATLRGRAEAIDGDSLRLRGVEIRLHGIDAPEYRQTCRDSTGRRYDCGRRAAAHLRRLLRGRRITCRRVTTDRYGRMVARCTTEDGQDIARRMVRDGWAIAFVRYSRAYVSDERTARAARRGIWRGRFIPPAAWRQTHR